MNKFTKYLMAFTASAILAGGAYIAVDKIVDNITTQKPAEKPPVDNPVTITYKATFLYGGLEKTQDVVAGECPKFEAFVNDGTSRFIGWYIDNEDELIDPWTYPITQDTIFIAKFEKPVNITFEGSADVQQVYPGEKIQKPADPVKEGYSFQGWSLDGINVVDINSVEITEDTVFVAIFKQDTYTITINIDDQTTTHTVNHGDLLSIEEPTKEGFNFIGWTIDGQVIDLETYTFTQDTTIVALFEEATTSASLFSFDESGNVTGYTGEETEISIPKTYSLGEVETVTNSYTTYYILNSSEKSYPFTITDSNSQVFEINSYSDLSINRSSIVFPATVTKNVQKFINGRDYSVTGIKANAFKSNTTLTSVVIPEGVTTIASNAFNGCTSLTSISIPEGITTLESSTFKGCTSLKTVTLPTTLTTMNGYLFQNCTALESISIPDSVTTFGSYLFDGCSKLTSVTLPNTLTAVPGYMFQNCTSLTEISIPVSVTKFGSNVFKGCSVLATINIPEGVTELGSQVFYECKKLAEITLPNSLIKSSSL